MSVATELALIYGNDLSLGPNGDYALSIDTLGSPQATYERILRIVLTNPLTVNDQGQPVVPPDNKFHGNFGAGVRAAIDEPFTPALQKAITARITQALYSDPYVSQASVVVSWGPGTAVGEYLLLVEANSILGQPFLFPPIPLTFAS